MVKRIFSLNAGSILLLVLIGTLFGFASPSHAQSIQNWSEPINLSKSGAGSNPSIVVDNQGVLHVLWLDRFDGYKYVQSTDGLSWSSPKSVDFPFALKQTVPPVFLADSNGFIHIFWLSEKNDLFYAQSLGENLGTLAAWRVRAKLDTSVFDFDVNMDAQGRLHLGYVRNPVPVSASGAPVVLPPNARVAGVYYQRSVTGGNNWTAPSLLYESAYFRSLTSEKARIRIAAGGEKVYAVWDDQAQKRIFMAISVDGGSSWNAPKELITPQASLGFRTPYHADVEVLQDKLLVTWRVGEPGVQCTPYSSVSSNDGESWEEPIRILAEVSGCPEKSEFLLMDPAYSVVLFTLQDDLSISAWNGNQWSNPEIQLGPSSVTNPETFDTVALGCEQVDVHQNKLFVVGCDQGLGGDIWFMSRPLDPLEKLFPLPSAWGGDINVTAVTQTITSLTSVTDAANHVHALWIQSSSSPTGTANSQIEYARWNGSEWTNPAHVLTNLSGLPLNLSLQIDSDQRLLLSWVNQETGDLMFSWANSSRANIPIEWMTPAVISTSSQLNNSPDMLVDASDRILVAYAVTLNEERGIYLIQSSDTGANWSSPVRVFDAMSANWEMVDQPKLAVTQDGKLHILFTQYSLLGGQEAVGLHYSQSSDGGMTWTAPQLVNKNPAEWSEIAAFKQTVHRFWREKDQSVISTYHQVSSDGGMTWSAATALPPDAGIVSSPVISLDGSGNVHLLQITLGDVYALEEWDWSTEQSQLVETRKLGIPKESSDITLESGITSQGVIYTLIQSKKPHSVDEIQTSILNVSRSLQLTESAQPFMAFVSTPSSSSLSTAVPAFQATPTLLSPLANIEDTQSETLKNVVGFILIVVVVALILLFTIPKRNKVTAKIRQLK